MYHFKRNDIVILLGAGASVEANIPHSGDMIKEVEKLIKQDNKWSQYRDLYNYIRSSIYHSDGIRGKFDSDVNYNIERLVNTLAEIKQKHKHMLYPFVGSWNPTLIEVAGKNFELIGQLGDEIVQKLRRKWIVLKNYKDADYFQGLAFFKREYEHPLRIFTLNYDLCVEKTCSEIVLNPETNETWKVKIERGFDEETRKWDWRNFDDNLNDEKDIFFYKLHGSNDWTYDQNEDLTYFDDSSRIGDKDAAIIFGTSYKLQYRDPFLFLAYEFRRWTLEARIIISIGYGFGDDHINRIIQQALNRNGERILLTVSPFLDGTEDEDKKNIKIADKQKEIAQIIDHKNCDQIKCCSSGAKNFITNHLRRDYLAGLLQIEEVELFPTISGD